MNFNRMVITFCLFLTAPTALAAGCDALFTRIDRWLEDGNIIRVVTTLSADENRVTYTRGYLDASETTLGTYDSDSSQYQNDNSDVAFPFRRLDNPTKLNFRKANDDTVQLNQWRNWRQQH